MTHRVAITGIGLISCHGVGAAETWQALAEGRDPVVDGRTLAPYPIHPAPEIDWSEQIARRGDQRQMEPWQRLGTFCAGLALDDAAIKGEETLTGTMDMIVAAGGGERDVDVDSAILAEAAAGRNDHGMLINEKLTTELRPTLFLAQLSNLLAGNISIVHKVTGSSRTFMGEEGSGMSALATAAARIRAGQSTHALVGGAFNAAHPDMLLSYELVGHLHRGDWAPVLGRSKADGGGMIMGSGAAFLVLEAAEHAHARGARIYAELGAVAADNGDDEAGATTARLGRLAAETGLGEADMVITTPSGAHARTAIEMVFLAETLADTPLRAVTNTTGSLRDCQFPFGVALAALSVHHGACPAATQPGHERPLDGAPSRIGVLTIGCEEAEGVAMVTAATGLTS
ncbi:MULTISPECIES: beta-ketoacyl-ACP synthase [unclassified Roseitalea]|uniref:beta-ketoacyl-ACP synthase n=1 Tax=unclassified Roseitalea TaxID=2639107 RepID=UPI00273E97A5|nr:MULTISPECIES: beta-ketoacyl-ACP synthase [unclassified Roseitalea]